MASSFSICRCARCGERAEARHGGVPGDLAEERHRRLVYRQWIVRKLVAEVGEGEFERVGELPRTVQRLGEVGEERAHLGCTFDMPLAVDAEELAGCVDVAAFADAGEDVVQLFVAGPSVTHAVRGDEREAEAAGQGDEGMIAMGLVAPVVALQLDMSARGKEAGQPLQRVLGRGHAAAAEGVGERPFVAAGEAAQASRVLLDELPGEARLPLGVVLGAGSEELAEVLVALAVLDEEAEAGAVIGVLGVGLFQHQLRADERLDAGLLRRHEEAWRAVDAVALDEGHGGKVVRRGMGDEILGERGGVEEGEGARRSELGVGPFRWFWSSYRRFLRLPAKNVFDVGEVVVLDRQRNGGLLRFLCGGRVARDAEVAGGRRGHSEFRGRFSLGAR